jgi:hypothetical protein
VTSPRTPTARTPNSISLEEVHSQSLNDVTAPIDNVTPWPVTTHEEQYATAEVSDSARPFHVIQDTLFASLSPAVPPLHVMDVVMHCIELYMQYTFAAAPLVHEPSLRASAALFFSEPPSIGRVTTSNNSQLVAALRGFALVTALCASVASMMPESLILYPCHALVKPFFHASREALRSIEDYDLEHPNSASLTTRVFHSTALQHMTGKHGAAWHVQGQAELIAQSLRLYNEQTIRRYDALEGQLLRMNFWHMYASDHVAAALRHRPCILHESLFDEEFTLQPYPQEDMPLMDPSRSGYDESFERQLQVGFHLFRRVATSAAKLVLGIRRYGSAEAENDKAGLARAYLEYTGLLDDLPHWLHNPNLEPSHAEGEAAMFHKKSFWVQRCTVVVTFHCLRLIILQQCIDSRLWDVVGLYDEPFALSVKKVEIIQDFLQTLDGIPFIYLQVKGEPTVSDITTHNTKR